MIFFELLEKKWAYFFYLIDVNKDGILKPEDFEKVVERLEENSRLTAIHVNYLRLQANKLFDTLGYECNIRGRREVTLGQWLSLLNKTRRNKNSRFVRMFRFGCVKFIFNLFDINQDGYIDYEEFREIYRIYGIGEQQIMLAFSRLDANHDGVLSKYEFDRGLDAFFTDENPNDLNYIFGEFHEPTPGYYRLAI